LSGSWRKYGKRFKSILKERKEEKKIGIKTKSPGK